MNDNRLGDGAILALFEDLALKAGQAIMKVYDAGFVTDTKADSSPVTEADRAAEKIILAGLRAAVDRDNGRALPKVTMPVKLTMAPASVWAAWKALTSAPGSKGFWVTRIISAAGHGR